MAKKMGAGGEAAKEKGMSKAEAVRLSIQANGWDAPLATHEEYLRNQFGIIMSRVQISQYKSTERRRAGKRRRRRRTPEEMAAAGAERATSGRGDDILKFVSAVRQWEEKLGSKKVLAVIEALYKQG